MRVVVDDGHARRLAEDLKPACRAAEIRARGNRDGGIDAGILREDQRRAGVLRVVETRKGEHDVERRLPASLDKEPLHAVLLAGVADPPVALSVRAICDDNTRGDVT